MLYIVIAVILFLSSIVSTYFSFYSYYAPDKSNALFMTFLIIGIICLLAGTVFVFLFINKKNEANLKDMTVITIAQRVASVKNCDKIVVLNEGEIASIGTHQELMATSPIYQDIYNSQLKRGDEANGWY